jgi:hypothetical protein
MTDKDKDVPEENQSAAPPVKPARIQRSAATASTEIIAVRSVHEQGLERAREIQQAGLNLKPLTAKQATFVQAVADGASAAEAYRFAYDCLHEKPSVITARASYLMSTPHIAAALYESRKRQQEKLLRDRETAQMYVIEHLQKVVETPGTHHSARVNALSLLGKYSGLFGESGAAGEKDRRPSAVIEQELRVKLRAFMDEGVVDVQASGSPIKDSATKGDGSGVGNNGGNNMKPNLDTIELTPNDIDDLD